MFVFLCSLWCEKRHIEASALTECQFSCFEISSRVSAGGLATETQGGD